MVGSELEAPASAQRSEAAGTFSTASRPPDGQPRRPSVARTWGQRLAVLATLAAYPLWFLWEPLTSTEFRHIGRGTSDINSALLQARILDAMHMPWEWSAITNSPSGEPFWRTSTVAQWGQSLLLWAATRLLDPANALALLVMVGWVITGLAVYLCARTLGAGPVGAVAAGVLAQCLPWMQAKSAAHTTYMFSGVVLICWLAVLQVLAERSRRNLILLALSGLAVCAIDIYLIYFTLIGIAAIAVGYQRGRRRRLTAVAAAVCGLALLSVGRPVLEPLENGVLSSLQRALGGMDRAVSVATPEDTLQWTSRWVDFITPHPDHLLLAVPWMRSLQEDFANDFVNYGGLLLLASGIAGFLLAYQSGARRPATALAAALIVLGILSVNTRFFVGSVLVPSLADSLALLTPGARVYSRAGLLSQLLVTAFAGVALSRVRHGTNRAVIGRGLSVLLVVMIAIDLNPAGGHRLVTEYDRYTSVRDALEAGPSRLLVIPATGRWYVDASYLSTPVVNGLRDNTQAIEIDTAIERGDPLLWCLLRESGVTHILAVDAVPQGQWDVQSNIDALLAGGADRVARIQTLGVYSNYSVGQSLLDVQQAVRDRCP